RAGVAVADVAQRLARNEPPVAPQVEDHDRRSRGSGYIASAGARSEEASAPNPVRRCLIGDTVLPGGAMTREDKLERINARPWYDSIEIEQGLVTPGAHPLPELHHALERVKLPPRLDGLSVLDIGAWDGFFSFEAERRGAKRVVAYDLTPEDYFGFST